MLREGKKRQIRHMTAAIGYPALRLIRWAIGPVTLSKLRLGESEHLTRSEVGALRQMVAEGVVHAAPDQAGEPERSQPTRRRPPSAGSNPRRSAVGLRKRK